MTDRRTSPLRVRRFLCNFAGMKRFVIWIVALTLASLSATAARVSLLTAQPGLEVFQLEGHTALRIIDDSGRDYVVNWGVFDFNSPNFTWRFVTGKTDYMCYAYPTPLFLESYRREGRRVIEQTLALDSMQTAAIIGMVANNLKPENQTYRYNYVLDNCATRPLDFIETAAGRTLISHRPAGTSFRNEMRRFHKEYPWYQFGIDLALGRSLDKEITLRQTAFAPMTLMERLDESGIVSNTGSYWTQTSHGKPTPWYLTPMSAAVIMLVLSVFVGTGRFSRLFDSLLFGIFFAGGCLLTFLVFVSEHEATSPNMLLLWLNPFCLLGAVLPWIKSAKKAEICYFFSNFALLIILAVLAPLLGRGMNPAFWPLIAADAVRSIVRIRQCLNVINRS